MIRQKAVATVLVFALVGCATPGDRSGDPSPQGHRYMDNERFAAIAQASEKKERDRLAILAMQGEYRVDFHFTETVPLKSGYQRKQDKTTGAFETVISLENGEDRIVLQHILVVPGGQVVKHWRQDWVYQASERFEFVADQSWEVRRLDAESTRGAWTQCVFEVSDAPRYCGTGRWNHRYGVSTWTSDRTWRPLPRREYTTREDYNALNAENRHTVTPHGWTHEQDNTKTVREGRETVQTLVREFGFNDYQRIEGHDFAPAYDYWTRTRDYWEQVRVAWTQRLVSGKTLVLETEVDGMPIIEATFEMARQIEGTPPQAQAAAIEDLLGRWTRVEAVPVAGQASSQPATLVGR